MRKIDVRYRGQNYLMFGTVKFVNGINPTDEDVFYRLMKTPLFRMRVESGVLEVPQGTPLEKPREKKMEKTTEKVIEKSTEKEVEKPLEKETVEKESEKSSKKKVKEADSETRFDEIK